MFALHKTLKRPSKLTQVIEANFTDPGHVNLITASGNLLRVYVLDSKRNRLSFFGEFVLHANISSMGTARIGRDRDSLLLTFADAKMSLVEYSANLNDIVTVSIHFYERDEFKKEATAHRHEPRVLVDPQSRVALLSFYIDKFAVLPLRNQAVDVTGMERDERMQPFHPSYVADSTDIHPDIKNIVDFAFLFDYLEPTFAVLYETEQTWTGRLARKQDTRALAVVSIDTAKKGYSILYTVHHLPYNVSKIVPVPSPVGGLLLVSPNGIIHIDQTSIPGVVCSVNSYWGYEEKIKVTKEDEMMEYNALYNQNRISDFSSLEISLDDCAITFLNPDTALLVTVRSEAFLLKLQGSETASGFARRKSGVKTFSLEKLGFKIPRPIEGIRLGGGMVPELGTQLHRSLGSLNASVISDESSLTIQCGYIFIASEQKNSVLLSFKEIAQEQEEMEVDDDFDDIYGTSASKSSSGVSKFVFKLCDILYSTSPVKDSCAGEPAVYSEFAYDPTTPRKELELLTCQEGSLVALQRNVRANIVVSFDMEGIVDLWTIKLSNGSKSHDFMVLSREDGTVLLSTADDIEEIEEHGLFKGPTVDAAVACDCKVIVQVFASGLRLLSSSTVLFAHFFLECTLLKEVLLPKGHEDAVIQASSIRDRFVFVGLSNGNGLLYSVAPNGIDLLGEIKDQGIVTFNLYMDETGIVTDCATSSSSSFMETEKTADCYLFVYCSNGDLGVYDMSLNRLFNYHNFNMLPRLLQETPAIGEASSFSIVDLLVTRIGSFDDSGYLYLLVRTESADLAVYKAFISHEIQKNQEQTFDVQEVDDMSPVNGPTGKFLSFKKISHNVMTRELKTYADLDKVAFVSEHESAVTKRRFLRKFVGIGDKNYQGVFMTGKRPVFVICKAESGLLDQLESNTTTTTHELLDPGTHQGHDEVFLHPMNCDGQVLSFAAFTNDNCPNGFVFMNHSGSLRFCSLLAHFNYDADWPFTHVPYGGEMDPQSIVYHHPSQKYVVAAAFEVPFWLKNAEYAASVAAGVTDPKDEEAKPQYEERDRGLYLPRVYEYKVLLVSPVTWEVVDKVDLLEYEQVLSMDIVSLESKETQTGRRHVLAIGTGFFRGEDLAARGRIILYNIIDVIPEIDNPQTNNKFKLLRAQEEKSAVTSLCGVSGHLLCAIGPKLLMYSFEDDGSLTGVAFLDVDFFVTKLSAVKNMIMVCDVVKSVRFAVFQEEPPKLALLGKDYHELPLLSGAFLIDNSSLGMLVSDNDANAHLLQYIPNNMHSLSGQRLIRRGDFHLGTIVRQFIRIRRIIDAKKQDNNRQQFCLGGGLDGSLRAITPVSDRIYKRLFTLYTRMVNFLQHHAGLNPRGFRFLRPPPSHAYAGTTTGPPGPRMILDGDLLYEFPSLSIVQQQELAKSIGSTVERIMDDLVEVKIGMDYF